MTRDEFEAAVWRILRGLGRHGRTHVDAILQAADAYAASTHDPPGVTAARRAELERAISDPVHYLDGAKVACGEPNANLVNTTDQARVTCGRCRNTRAWKDTT